MPVMNLPIVADDPLGVLTSTQPVVVAARHVRIDESALSGLAASFADLVSPAPGWGDDLHFRDDTWRTATWVFVLDALNFCFWSPDPQRRWQVSYQGEEYDGYWALVAALRRAMDDGYPLWDAEFLRDLDLPTVAHLLRTDDTNDPEIPLLEARWRNLTELGGGLLAFQSDFGARPTESPVETLLRHANHSASALIAQVRSSFPSFDDVLVRETQEIRFLKRAQILVADLHAAFGGAGLGHFEDLDSLTAFADYKVPQVLRRLGILAYSDELAARIDNRALIAAGSAEEIEIRAATIWAVELLRQSVEAGGRHIAAHEIDWALWQAGQSADAADRPYHRTLTIFY